MKAPIVNIADIELQPRPPELSPNGEAAGRYDARMGLVGRRIGARKLGYNVTSVPPGMRAFPLHNHRVNEEMFFVLEGRGELRIGADTHPVRAGDIIACPAGGPETAHQIINSGDGELKYLAVSTQSSPELVEYPDSGKFGVLAELSEEDGGSRRFAFIGRESACLDYWEGE